MTLMSYPLYIHQQNHHLRMEAADVTGKVGGVVISVRDTDLVNLNTNNTLLTFVQLQVYNSMIIMIIIQ